MLLYSVCLIVGASIRGVTVGLISTHPVTALKKNNMSRYLCQYVRESRLIEWAYPYVIVDNEMEDWGCILKLVAESASLCKPLRSIEGPTLLLHTQGGTSTMLNRWFILKTRFFTLGVTPDETKHHDRPWTDRTNLFVPWEVVRNDNTEVFFSAVEIPRACSINS